MKHQQFTKTVYHEIEKAMAVASMRKKTTAN